VRHYIGRTYEKLGADCLIGALRALGRIHVQSGDATAEIS
jgi:hypothetical protein